MRELFGLTTPRHAPVLVNTTQLGGKWPLSDQEYNIGLFPVFIQTENIGEKRVFKESM